MILKKILIANAIFALPEDFKGSHAAALRLMADYMDAQCAERPHDPALPEHRRRHI